MLQILNNPYRTIGILVGASAREQERQIKRLKQFIDADQAPDNDFSFPILGELHRTLEKVSDAACKLNLDSDKINAALFWFYKGNVITDEPAFDYMKEGDLQNAVSLWAKLTNDKEVDKKNASAFHNLSTLILHSAFNNQVVKESLLEKGLKLRLKFLESDHIKDFIAVATDETFRASKKELQILFLNQLLSEVDRKDGISPNKYIEILIKQEFSAKDDFLRVFVQRPIEQIEKQIEETRLKRKKKKQSAGNIGLALFEQTVENISLLKSILTKSDIKYSSISDKISDEILQCGFEYFISFRDTEVDPTKITKELFKEAESLAVGDITKQSCQEYINNLQEWIDEKPEREKLKKIESDLTAFLEIMKAFENESHSFVRQANISGYDNIVFAKKIIDQCKPHLNNIKLILGSSDEFYLKLSTSLASQAQSKIIDDVNKAQKLFESEVNLNRYAAKNKIRPILEKAWEITLLIGTLDLEYDFKTNRYNKNKETLLEIIGVMAVIPSSSTITSSTTPNRPTVPNRPMNNTTTYNKSTSSQKSWAEKNPGCLAQILCLGLGAVIGAAITADGDVGSGLAAGAFFGFLVGSFISKIVS